MINCLTFFRPGNPSTTPHKCGLVIKLIRLHSVHMRFPPVNLLFCDNVIRGVILSSKFIWVCCICCTSGSGILAKVILWL